MSKNLIMLSTTPWDSPFWFRRQYFAKHLAERGWRVLYCDPRHTVIRVLQEKNFKALRQNLLTDQVMAQECDGRLRAIRPRTAPPLYWRGRTSVWGRRLLAPALHACARKHFGSDSYAQVVYHPFDHFLLRRDLPVVYEVVDKWTAYPGMNSIGHMEQCDAELRNFASAVIGTTGDLITGVPEDRKHIIPNGVDTTLFDIGKTFCEPADLAAIPHPRILYAGALWEWFDYDLLNEIAARLPNAHIVLLGFSKQPLPELPPNVHFLGMKPQSELPSYYAHADVGIIPFRDIELTKHVNPLKFYEYMAMGLPCVSVPMDPIVRYEQEGILALRRDKNAFTDALSEMIKMRHCRVEERICIARENDWEALSHSFESIVADVLKQ